MRLCLNPDIDPSDGCHLCSNARPHRIKCLLGPRFMCHVGPLTICHLARCFQSTREPPGSETRHNFVIYSLGLTVILAIA